MKLENNRAGQLKRKNAKIVDGNDTKKLCPQSSDNINKLCSYSTDDI